MALFLIFISRKENILLPPAEKLAEDNEEIISGIAKESSCSNHHNLENNSNKSVIDNKKSLKEEGMKEELKKLNLDKKSIDKIILNYSLEDIEEKLELLKIKRNIINPAGWLIAALKANYINPESYKEENDEEEKIIKTEEVQPESKIVKPDKLALKEKQEEEKKKLFLEEELKWISQIKNNILK